MSLTPTCGELVFVTAPSVGYRKYHLCLGPNAQGIYLFLFLNSENGFDGDCVFTCGDFPSIPASKTGESVVSFGMIPRFSQAQLDLYGAASFGTISKSVASTLKAHLPTVKTLTKSDKAFVDAALDALC